ncbi:MAG: hypothetical protein ACHQJD_04010 [Thermoanaerobaculia bacterium]
MRKTSLVSAAGALGAAAAIVALAGCASGRSSIAGPVVAEAKDLPDHFTVAATGIASSEEPSGGEGCRNPMMDPRDGTLLHLVRSKDGKGDYQVLSTDFELKTQYGVDSRHLLRLDCATGKALGIVNQ